MNPMYTLKWRDRLALYFGCSIPRSCGVKTGATFLPTVILIVASALRLAALPVSSGSTLHIAGSGYSAYPTLGYANGSKAFLMAKGTVQSVGIIPLVRLTTSTITFAAPTDCVQSIAVHPRTSILADERARIMTRSNDSESSDSVYGFPSANAKTSTRIPGVDIVNCSIMRVTCSGVGLRAPKAASILDCNCARFKSTSAACPWAMDTWPLGVSP